MGQILGFIYALFLILSNFGEKRTKILVLQTISFLFKAMHYLLLGGLSGFVTSIISSIRNIVFCKYKSKILTIIFIIIYIIVTIFTYNKIYSIIPAFATVFYTIIINKGTYCIKLGIFITAFSWLVYNICIFSISGIIIQIVIIIVNIISITLDKKNQITYNNNGDEK